VVEQASRLVLPDERLVDAVVAARCDLLLEGPTLSDADSPVRIRDRSIDEFAADVGFVLDVAEIVRCGDDPHAWLPEVVEPTERLARRGAKRGASEPEVADAVHALEAVRLVARRAGDDVADGDVGRALERVLARHGEVDRSFGRISGFADARRATSVGRFVRSIERRIVDRQGVDGAVILPGGIPTSWIGSNFEVHSIPVSSTTSLSFAVRWHGDRPAVLWEQHGEPVTLSAPDIDAEWRSDEVTGEALWSAPSNAGPRRSSLSITIGVDSDVDPDADASFS
jgi:hypothetical protein